MVHEPLRRRSGRAGRAMDFYAKGLARMEDRWAGTGVSGLGFLDLNHPYTADLDLFGAGSLFERLCTARTRAGEDALASWLLAPALPETLTKRHEALTELRPRLDLREDLELLGSDVRSGIDPEALAAWGKAPRVFPGSGLRIAAAILALLGAAEVIGWAFFESGVIPLLVTGNPKLNRARRAPFPYSALILAASLFLLPESCGRAALRRDPVPDSYNRAG